MSCSTLTDNEARCGSKTERRASTVSNNNSPLNETNMAKKLKTMVIKLNPNPRIAHIEKQLVALDKERDAIEETAERRIEKIDDKFNDLTDQQEKLEKADEQRTMDALRKALRTSLGLLKAGKHKEDAAVLERWMRANRVQV